MSLISGTTTNYTDPNTGSNFPIAWLQIRQINYVAQVSCLVVVDVYSDEAAYQAGLSPVFYNILPQLNSSDSDFTTYFDISIMQQADHDILTQSVAYLTSQF